LPKHFAAPKGPFAVTRNAVTDHYLEQTGRLGLDAHQLPTFVDQVVDLGPTSYLGRGSLSRPVYLDRDEVAQLTADLDQLTAALGSLPKRLFGGDMEAFARAVGFAESQVQVVLRGNSPGPTRICRADIYHDGTNFKLMEFNQGSPLGGLDVGFGNKGQVQHPAFAEYLESAGLTWIDPIAEIAESVFIECNVPRDRRPRVAAVDLPDAIAQIGPQLQASADQLSQHGLDVLVAHLGELEYRDQKVWLHGEPLDGVYRIFLIEDMLQPERAALIDPLLGALERGEIWMFTPLDADVYESKATLAMISDEANRHLFDADELASLDRLLPWTRMVRDEQVTVDDQRVDLLAYAEAEQHELVLKPAAMHGGIGVTMGWLVEPDEWNRTVREALDGPYVLQRRIHPEPEPFPTADGGLVPMLLNWGVFRMSRGFGGAFVRGSTDLSGAAMSVDTGGMTLGTVYFEKAD
jgi:hypothetical protein